MPAGVRDAYCHEGGTVLEPRKDGRRVGEFACGDADKVDGARR